MKIQFNCIALGECINFISKVSYTSHLPSIAVNSRGVDNLFYLVNIFFFKLDKTKTENGSKLY
jgi:hypothetical protein